MGYTHYFKGLKSNEFIADALEQIVEKAREHGIFVGDGWGIGAPIISADEIAINGDASKGLDHETFYLSDDDGFNFCKTARKPYDAVVVATLVYAIVGEHEGAENICSDGTWEDWVDVTGNGSNPIGGIALYEEVFGPLSDDEIALVKSRIGE